MPTDKIVAAQLSAEENENIFRNFVIRRELPRNSEPLDNPVIIMVGGQPGAGKTSLVTSGFSELSLRGATVQIVGDNLRSYHPRFEAFQMSDPALSSQLTHHDASRWTDKLLVEAASQRLNIVFENTMRSPEAASFLAQQFHVAGYRVESRVVAVNERESWQGCRNRYEQMYSEGNAARLPPKEHHDNAVIGLVETIRHLEVEKLVDAVQVRLRNGQAVFDNQLVDGVWLKPEGAATALTDERNRVRTRSELEAFSADWQMVLARMENRKADPADVENVRKTAVDDMLQFRSQRSSEVGILQVPTIRAFNELYSHAVRDASTRPHAQLEEHASGRLAKSYAALRLIEIARDNDAIPTDARIVSTGVRAESRKTNREFPQAWRIPTDLAVVGGDGLNVRLSEHFATEKSRAEIEGSIFAATDCISRLANLADRWLEQGGIAKSLILAANMVARDKMSADEAMTRIVEPGYQGSIIRGMSNIERNLSYAERTAINRSFVDEQGRRLHGLAQDFKLRLSEIEIRQQVLAMLEQAYIVYGKHVHLEHSERQRIDRFIEGISENERSMEIIRGPLIPAQRLPDLTSSEIAERVQASEFVQRKRAEAEQLSSIVFGSSAAVSDALSRIDSNPALASGIANELKSEPFQFGELAGKPGGWIRRAAPERQKAEANFSRLARSIEDYGNAVNYQQWLVAHDHSAEQRRANQEVPMPSVQLSAALRSPVDVQVQRFTERPELRKELTLLSVCLDKRLAPLEHKALHDGDLAAAQQSLAVSASQIRQIAQAKQQFKEANQLVRIHTIAQQRGPVITR
ncbi:zeta toxin [Ochrobactrum sp. BH3]|nr:zeta toxin [Ochrobactrum sp. BH3]